MSNRPERSSRAQGAVASTVLLQFSREEMITWHEMRQFQQLSNCPNLQKVGHDIVIFNGNVLRHARKCTNEKRMSCSLLICHTQIFKSIDFRTMGLSIWITFFYIRTVVLISLLNDFKIIILFLYFFFFFFFYCMQGITRFISCKTDQSSMWISSTCVW